MGHGLVVTERGLSCALVDRLVCLVQVSRGLIATHIHAADSAFSHAELCFAGPGIRESTSLERSSAA